MSTSRVSPRTLAGWSRPVHTLCTQPVSEFIHVLVVLCLGLAFVLSSITSASYNPFTSFSLGFPELLGERFDGDIPFRTECSTIFHPVQLFSCGSLYLFPSPVGASRVGVPFSFKLLSVMRSSSHGDVGFCCCHF